MSYKEILKEIKEKNKSGAFSHKNVSVLNIAWLKEHPQCEDCGATDNLTVDHIIPKTLLLQFGIDPHGEFIEKNLKALCVRCNHFKAARLDFKDKRTKPLLLEFLNRI